MVHEAYQGHMVMVYADGGARCEGVEAVPPRLRWFAYDLFTKDRRALERARGPLPSPGKNPLWPPARQTFAENFFRSNALHCTATARILIPAECSAVS